MKKIIFLLIGISFNLYSQNIKKSKISTPEVGVTANCLLGNPILNVEILNEIEGHELRDSIVIRFMDAKLILPPCDLIFLEEDKKYKTFKTTQKVLYTKQLLTGVVYHFGILKMNKVTLEVERVKFEESINYLKIKDNKPPKLYPKSIFAIGQPSYRKDFIYNGKSGQVIKFTYREFVDDFSRPSFTQDVQYDLTEGNKIGFKELEVEIIAATNMGIQYKILSGF